MGRDVCVCVYERRREGKENEKEEINKINGTNINNLRATLSFIIIQGFGLFFFFFNLFAILCSVSNAGKFCTSHSFYSLIGF